MYISFNRSTRGFTLIELLVVIAIIGLLSSVVLSSLNAARARGRDTRRIADFGQLRTAFELYYSDHGQYPGGEDNVGTQISQGCESDLKTDLVDGGYIAALPTDPAQSTTNCDGRSTDLRDDDNYFYGWDSGHCCEGSYCISINRLETDWAVDQLSNYPDNDGDISNGIQYVTGGGDANIGTGDDFNYCFVDQQ